MKISSFYPVICTDKVEASKQFYTTNFPFEISFETDWYVSLVSADNKFELAIVKYHHPSVPESFRNHIQGVILNFEVENVDSVYERFKEQNVEIVQNLKDEEWGQRHFIISDPNGILIDIIEMIEPSIEYLNDYN